MPRLMSVAFTKDAVADRRKTVTRRKGWWEDSRGRRIVKPGDTITLCEKVMGRKKGEPLVRLVDVEIVSVRRERLDAITQDDVALEGFPDMDRADFINRFFVDAQDIYPHELVTRIEWKYLDAEADLFSSDNCAWCDANKHERCRGADGCACGCNEKEEP